VGQYAIIKCLKSVIAKNRRRAYKSTGASSKQPIAIGSREETMPDNRKKYAELQKEIKSLRLRVAELEKDELRHSRMEAPPKSDLLYQTLMENIHLGISLMDTDHRIVTTNAGSGKFFRKPHSEFAGKHCFREFEKRNAVCSHCPGTRAMATGHPAEVKSEGVRDDGSRFAAHLRAFPVFEADGAIKGFIEIVEDITEHKQTEEKLQESENKYRTLLENLPQKIFLKNRSSVYVSCNANYANDMRIKPDEIAGKTDYEFYPKEFAEKYRADDKRIMESGKTEDIEEKYIKDGQELFVHTVKTPVRDKQGNAVGLLGIFWDITEHKKAEEELNIYHERMVRAERLASLGTLSATLAHELTQPLTVIRLSIENSLEDLEATSCPKTVIEGLRDSLNEVSNATSVVDRFRNFARQSSRKTLCETDLGVIADRIVQLLGKTAQRAKMTLHLEGLDKLPPVYSNEKDLEQLFFALTENAIQAVDDKKSHRLIIEGVVKGKNIELRFSDNCSGIAPENLNKIFDPFFTTGSDDGRTGLGLSIVQRIVSEYGGKISVQSQQGCGTTFYVTLPIHSEIVR
jgi:PAS domain S-box-containing protein